MNFQLITILLLSFVKFSVSITQTVINRLITMSVSSSILKVKFSISVLNHKGDRNTFKLIT